MSLTPLPSAWVDALVSRMAAVYGEKFLHQWARVDPDAMRATWGEMLGCFSGDQIKWAIGTMVANNPFPPTLPEFIALCRSAPRPEVVALPEPAVSPEVARQRSAEISKAAEQIMAGPKNHKKWAEEILANPKAFPPISVKFARMALSADDAT